MTLGIKTGTYNVTFNITDFYLKGGREKVILPVTKEKI